VQDSVIVYVAGVIPVEQSVSQTVVYTVVWVYWPICVWLIPVQSGHVVSIMVEVMVSVPSIVFVHSSYTSTVV
jgi:hypothetical protein